jgi:hypothetical protein
MTQEELIKILDKNSIEQKKISRSILAVGITAVVLSVYFFAGRQVFSSLTLFAGGLICIAWWIVLKLNSGKFKKLTEYARMILIQHPEELVWTYIKEWNGSKGEVYNHVILNFRNGASLKILGDVLPQANAIAFVAALKILNPAMYTDYSSDLKKAFKQKAL